MGLNVSGMDVTLSEKVVIKTAVLPEHPIIKLMNILDWQELANLVMPDLKRTTAKKTWEVGRKLKVRVHLGAYCLQQLLNLEQGYRLKHTAC